jgi:RNA polymerase sigma-70 factor (ECF subfamily)
MTNPSTLLKTKPDTEAEAAFTGGLKTSWHRFLELYEPLRPRLYRFCRYLTRSPWDAEDLVQDVLARAFTTLAQLQEPPRSPQAWLIRVASNLWIDRMRAAGVRSAVAAPAGAAAGADGERELKVVAAAAAVAGADARATREAAGTLLVQLAPQERAAVVLKDVFDLELDEIAEALSTTVGAVKAALHRGRGKLAEPASDAARTPVPAALDAFCAAFNARDLDRLTALLLDHAAVEVVGASAVYGREAARGTVLTGMLFGSRRMSVLVNDGDCIGIDLRFSQDVLPEPARLELRPHRGEILLLSWYAHRDGEFVRAVSRVELADPGENGEGGGGGGGGGGEIAHLRNYFFTPEVIAEVCGELGLPYRVNGTYRVRGPA